MAVSSALHALTRMTWLLSMLVENVESSWSKSYVSGFVLK